MNENIDFIFNALCGLIIAGLSCGILRMLSHKKTEQYPRIHVDLSNLARIWAPNSGEKTVTLETLAPIWQGAQSTVPIQKDEVAFQHKRAEQFWRAKAKWLATTSLHKEICLSILTFLDQEGSCSSVVNVKADIESSWDSNTFKLLGGVTLLDHSLNVAEELIKILVQEDSAHIIPDALICALGHDLGKTPSCHPTLYSLHDHPLTSASKLSSLKSFGTLLKAEEILSAIKHHHRKPEGFLGKILKRADQRARQRELENEGRKKSENYSQKQDSIDSVNADLVALGTSLAIQKTQKDIFNLEIVSLESSSKYKDHPKKIDISGWFVPEEFLMSIQTHINKISGRTFVAFSMPDGHVYVQAKVLEETARLQAQKAQVPQIALMTPHDRDMRDVLYTIVDFFRKKHIIDPDLIKEGFFGGYFTVSFKNSNELKGFYIPFFVEPFGLVSRMEAQKTGILSNIVKVQPYAHTEKSES